jgi:putative GTP pyrophosphokinase
VGTTIGVNRKEVTRRGEQTLEAHNELDEFRELMMQYECAMLEVRTKLEVLNSELSLQNSRNPFESIKARLKQPDSIFEKLERNGIELSVANIEHHLNDIAGIRVICSFPDDIYMLAKCLTDQDDITLIERKDYIKNPKENGYRSLHLIIEVPIFLTDRKKQMRVEVQMRTIAMDFWASLEHKLKYKKHIKNADSISNELYYCAELITQLDGRMQQIRQKIENDGESA